MKLIVELVIRNIAMFENKALKLILNDHSTTVKSPKNGYISDEECNSL